MDPLNTQKQSTNPSTSPPTTRPAEPTIQPPAHASNPQNPGTATAHTVQNNATQPAVSLEDRQKSLRKKQLISSGKGFLGLAAFVAGAFVLALFINRFLFHSFQVVGSSMSPTLEQDDWLVINRLGKTLNSVVGKDFYPERGSVVVFDDPRGAQSNKTLIKRVIAIPGERVTLENGELRVYNDEFPQGFDPDADYKDTFLNKIVSAPGIPAEGLVVPDGEIFVSGDNRSNSTDSRNSLGTVPIDKIIGTLSVRLFPLDKLDISF